MFFNSTPSISTAEAAKHIGEQGVGFIDVRTSAEYTSGHAENAVNSRNTKPSTLSASQVGVVQQPPLNYVMQRSMQLMYLVGLQHGRLTVCQCNNAPKYGYRIRSPT
jgi:rhodanese-related sulfurtransferase